VLEAIRGQHVDLDLLTMKTGKWTDVSRLGGSSRSLNIYSGKELGSRPTNVRIWQILLVLKKAISRLPVRYESDRGY